MSKMRIDWNIFFDNSSTEEAIILFALGHYSFKRFSQECWPKECKLAIKYLKHRGYTKARRAANCALRVRGFEDYKEDYRGFMYL